MLRAMQMNKSLFVAASHSNRIILVKRAEELRSWTPQSLQLVLSYLLLALVYPCPRGTTTLATAV